MLIIYIVTVLLVWFLLFVYDGCFGCDFIFIIVSYIFISLLLVTLGIVYSRAGSNVNVVTFILFDGENISFEARLVIYRV